MTSYLEGSAYQPRSLVRVSGDIKAPCAKWPDLHHPIGAGKPAVRQALDAIEVCVECPLMVACRADADWRRPLDEIAGGWDYNAERRFATAVHLGQEKAAAAARAKTRPRARVAECGTESGYRRHRSRKEKPCTSCRMANRRAAQKRRARQESAA